MKIKQKSEKKYVLGELEGDAALSTPPPPLLRFLGHLRPTRSRLRVFVVRGWMVMVGSGGDASTAKDDDDRAHSLVSSRLRGLLVVLERGTFGDGTCGPCARLRCWRKSRFGVETTSAWGRARGTGSDLHLSPSGINEVKWGMVTSCWKPLWCFDGVRASRSWSCSGCENK